jgi:hypothetical protein
MSCYVIESCLAKLARLACPKALAVDWFNWTSKLAY